MAKQINLEGVFGNAPYWTINKKLYLQYGFEATLLLQHFHDLQTKVFHGEFFQTHEKITEELGLKRRKIENAIEILKEAGFLSVVKKGLPQTNHFKVEIANLSTFLLYSEIIPSPSKISGMVRKKITVI
jgi:hypothetical protein